MPRTRLITVLVVTVSVLAALVFSAATVWGWIIARPIGVVSGFAALTNIALVSSPTSPLGRRLALVFGVTVQVAAVAVGAWGLISNAPWWLGLMPIVGALLMLPMVLQMIGFSQEPAQIEPEQIAEEPSASAQPSMLVQLDEDPVLESAGHSFFATPSDDAPISLDPELAGARAEPMPVMPMFNPEPDSAPTPVSAAEPQPESASSPEPESEAVPEPESALASQPQAVVPADEPTTDLDSSDDFDEVVITATRGYAIDWDALDRDDRDDRDESTEPEAETTGRHAFFGDSGDDEFDDILDTATRGIMPVFDDDDDDWDDDEDGPPTIGRRAL